MPKLSDCRKLLVPFSIDTRPIIWGKSRGSKKNFRTINVDFVESDNVQRLNTNVCIQNIVQFPRFQYRMHIGD